MLRGLTDADRERPSPCAEFSTHQLAEHLVGSLTGLGRMAGVTVVAPEEGSLEHRVSTMAAQAIDAYRALDLDGTVPGPRGQMPAALAAGILSVEFVLHAWDLAQASGQSVAVSDEVVAYVRGLAEQLVPGGRGAAFGPEAEPAAGASPLDRLAAYSGRRLLAD